MTSPKRVDLNTPEILEALYALDFEWLDTHALGGGFPDGLAVKETDGNWRLILVEIKRPGGRLTPAEREFAEDHPGLVHIWRTQEDVINDLRKEIE